MAPNGVLFFIFGVAGAPVVLSMPKLGDSDRGDQVDHWSTFHVSLTAGRKGFVNWSWWKAMKCVVV